MFGEQHDPLDEYKRFFSSRQKLVGKVVRIIRGNRIILESGDGTGVSVIYNEKRHSSVSLGDELEYGEGVTNEY